MTGLLCAETEGKRKLCKQRVVVNAVGISNAVTDFWAWLRSVSSSSGIILTDHNCMAFDLRMLQIAAENVGLLQEQEAVVVGFADTLPTIRSLNLGRTSYKLESLAAEFLQEGYDAHDAVVNVAVLCKLLVKLDGVDFAGSITSCAAVVNYRRNAVDRPASFKENLKGILSDGMQRKAALAQLPAPTPLLGRNGLQMLLLGKRCDGQAESHKQWLCCGEAATHFTSSMTA